MRGQLSLSGPPHIVTRFHRRHAQPALKQGTREDSSARTDIGDFGIRPQHQAIQQTIDERDGVIWAAVGVGGGAVLKPQK